MIQVKMLFGEGETGYLFNLEDKMRPYGFMELLSCEEVPVEN